LTDGRSDRQSSRGSVGRSGSDAAPYVLFVEVALRYVALGIAVVAIMSTLVWYGGRVVLTIIAAQG
jgi:hypothetical protein